MHLWYSTFPLGLIWSLAPNVEPPPPSHHKFAKKNLTPHEKLIVEKSPPPYFRGGKMPWGNFIKISLICLFLFFYWALSFYIVNCFFSLHNHGAQRGKKWFPISLNALKQHFRAVERALSKETKYLIYLD